MLSLKVPEEENYRISPRSVCALYLMIKLHMSGKYDAIKYNWKYGISQASFNNRRDKRFFESIAYKYRLHELTYLFVSSFLMKKDDWIGGASSEQAGINYRQYDSLLRIYNKEFTKELEIIFMLCKRDNLKLTDIFKYDQNKGSSRIFELLKLGIIKYETFLILDRMFNFINVYDELSEDYEWMQYSAILRAYRKLLIIDMKMAVDIFATETSSKLGIEINREKLLNKAVLNGENICQHY